MRAASFILCSVLAAGLQAASAQGVGAPRISNTAGNFLSVHLDFSAWEVDHFVNNIESGIGGGVKFGAGLTQSVAIYVNGAAAAIIPRTGKAYSLRHFEGGLRYYVGEASNESRYYVELGAGYRTAGFRVQGRDFHAHGPHGFLGGGMVFFLRPYLAADIGAKFAAGPMDQSTLDGQTLRALQATSFRFNPALVYYFNRR